MADWYLSNIDRDDASIIRTEALQVQQHCPGMLLLRGDAEQLGLTLAAAGLHLPAANRMTGSGGLRGLWQSPSRCLLLMPFRDYTDIAKRLRGIDGGALVLDADSQFTVLTLAGASAATCINNGCSLDLRDAVFSVGACAGTRVERIPVSLARTEPQQYLLLAERSLGAHLIAWLHSVGAEFAATTTTQESDRPEISPIDLKF